MSLEETQAARVTGILWAAIHSFGGTGILPCAGHRHHRAAFDPEWLATLPLPVDHDRPGDAPVALLDEQRKFDRHTDEGVLRQAYKVRRRTRVYEDIGRDTPHAWYSHVAQHLGRLAASDLQVVCSIFQSNCGDAGLAAHWDTWYGAIVQISGAKTWRIGPGLFNNADPLEVLTTTAGDVLLLPKGLPHRVDTPPSPGTSLHLTFAIDREDIPTDTAAGHAR
ncbi:JmjC domain-containing protein [Spirillospora sp. CA-294931]|uniref:JmjC domain-containing protein n=1 Tax=Spirillospora sp. CA-294931 TaxID=3240042 RepID=UPI003D92EDA5